SRGPYTPAYRRCTRSSERGGRAERRLRPGHQPRSAAPARLAPRSHRRRFLGARSSRLGRPRRSDGPRRPHHWRSPSQGTSASDGETACAETLTAETTEIAEKKRHADVRPTVNTEN